MKFSENLSHTLPPLVSTEIGIRSCFNDKFCWGIGNHDVLSWDSFFLVGKGYATHIAERLEKMNATTACKGEVGVNMLCTFKGLSFVLSGVGTR